MRRRQAIKIMKANNANGQWGHRTTREAVRVYLRYLRKKWGCGGYGWPRPRKAP